MSNSTSPPKSMVIATAGHIDHGKTTLIGALTGVETDRLPEEKRRGISIDLGFASLPIEAEDGSRFRISFVDVPGHSHFVRNMLAGAGCVAAVVLVIAADEGIKPQTKEHLAICELLGISDGITVLSKADKVSEAQLANTCGQVREFLQGTFLSGGTILPVSARTGDGLPALRTELLRLAMRAQFRDESRPARMPLDRSFVKKGFGTVVTGTLLSDELREGQMLLLEPGARSVRVRGLQTHGEAEPAASAGARVAVNLSGTEANEVYRGQTLVAPGTYSAVETIDAEIRLLEGSAPLRHRARVHFHAFTSEVMASVFLYGYEAAQPGSVRIARIRLASPVVLTAGDRFVLRQPLPAGTIGGGRILDAHPLPRQRKAATLAWLEQMRRASAAEQALLRVERSGPAGLRIGTLATEMGLTQDAARDMNLPLLGGGELLLAAGDLLLTRKTCAGAGGIILAQLQPGGSPGAQKSLRRSELMSQARLRPEVFEFALDSLARQRKLFVRGEMVFLDEPASQVPQRDTALLEAIADSYRKAGLTAPSVPEVVRTLRLREADVRRGVTLLLRNKTLIRMGSEDAFVHTEALQQLIGRLAKLRGTTLDVGGFKQLTGLPRKYAIPLLEYLDREHITRRQGDRRLVL